MPFKDPVKRREYARAAMRRWREKHHEHCLTQARQYKNRPESKAQVKAHNALPYRQAQLRAWARAYHAKDRVWLRAQKDKPCLDCGGRYPPECMDFDHVRGVKRKSVAALISQSIAVAKEEIKKCELVCANCHRMRTVNRIKQKVQQL